MGAITEPAWASRKYRSMEVCLEKAAPPQACIASEVTRIAVSPAAALTSRTRSMVCGPGFSSAPTHSSIRCASPSVSICIWASVCRSVGSASPSEVLPRCSNLLVLRWATVAATTARQMPRDTVALARLNQGRTMFSLAANPPPSSVSRRSSPTSTPSRVIGDDAVARSPRPSQGAATRIPVADRGTRYSVESVGPFASGDRVVTT